MGQDSGPVQRAQTNKLDSSLADISSLIASDIVYRPVPHPDMAGSGSSRPVWRVRFDLTSDPSKTFGLDINDEIVFGRGNDVPNKVDLTEFDATNQGVSRNHIRLKPTATALYVVDLGSTNGTLRNGQPLGVNTPYALVNGDSLTLGKLQFSLKLVSRPSHMTTLEQKADLADALAQVAKSITSQLDIEEVLNQVVEAAMTLTNARETGIWLVDQESGELFLEAQRGINDEVIKRMRIPISEDSMAAKVVQTGNPVRASRQPGADEKIKVKTDYLVESLLFMPLKLGGVTFGVLASTNREGGKRFSERDERLLSAIADFAAIAIQNARAYQATDDALNQRLEEMSALNDLTAAVSASLDLSVIYDILVSELVKMPMVQDVIMWLPDGKGSLSPYPDNPHVQDLLTRTGKQFVDAVNKVVDESEMVVTSFIDADSIMSPENTGMATTQMKARSLVALPLKAKGQVVGALALVSRHGAIGEQDIERFQTFSNPVATAIDNARLYKDAQRARSVIFTTAETLSQPLLILDEGGNIVISNTAAKEVLKAHMTELFEGLSQGVGSTTEIELGDKTYLATSESTEQSGTIIVMQDITYEKQLEEDQAEFVRTLSHDLKSPLTSIKGWAQLVQQVAKLEEKPDRYIGQIVNSADRMLDMINNLLDTIKAREAARITQEPCDFAYVVKRVVSDMQGAALGKSIKINHEVSGLSYQIMGDETRLYHMALNLVENAIKYSPEDTEVDVQLSFRKDDIELAVGDEGAGIPEGELEHIFERYFRGSGQESTGGAGLGLSVVKAIVTAHQGKVSVANRPGGGAVFVVTLPGSLKVKKIK